MKSRLVILTMLVLGMLLSTTGAGLAVTGLSGTNAVDRPVRDPDARPEAAASSATRTPAPAPRPRRTAAAARAAGPPTPSLRGRSRRAPTTAALPFTGFAAIPVLLGGIALLSAGLVLRRRTGDER